MLKMARRLLLTAVVTSAALGAASCTQPAPVGSSDDPQASSYGLISPRQAELLMEEHRENPEFVLLDIRRTEEVEAGHIAGTAMLDYYGSGFRDELAQLDRDATYLIYCRTGNRTGKTATMMEELGFEKVYDLKGGITAWTAAGMPVCIGPLNDPICPGI